LITDYAWLLPVIAGVFFLMALAKLGKTSSKLFRQTQRLEKQLAKFKATDHSSSKEPVTIEPGKPEEAASKRRAYLKQRTKNKTDRQRRLVKRLSNLSSQESE
jgi:biopolymer transport protein ExbB/TolQ